MSQMQPLKVVASGGEDVDPSDGLTEFAKQLEAALPTKAMKSDDVDTSGMAIMNAVTAKTQYMIQTEAQSDYVLGEAMGYHVATPRGWEWIDGMTSQQFEVRSKTTGDVAGYVFVDFAD